MRLSRLVFWLLIGWLLYALLRSLTGNRKRRT